MSPYPLGVAFNKTRQTFLATEMRVANTHWKRLRGLIGTVPAGFPHGKGLWIVPCRGVHTWLMRFPVDAIYLNRENVVIHIEEALRPWRFAPIRLEAASVLEVPVHTVFNSGTRVGDKFELRVNGMAVAAATITSMQSAALPHTTGQID